MNEQNDFQKWIGSGEKQFVYGKHVGTAKDILIYREDNGKLGGKQTEHWDGHVDATVIAPHVKKNLTTGEVTSS